jgi:hypothetical protein
MNRFAAALLLCACLTLPAAANDTMATLGTGGLTFINSENVKMLKEDLYISPSEVRVRYEFRNDGDADEPTLVAFPMPDITGSPDFMVSVPTEDPENIFGFETTVDGEPVEATLHQYAFAHNIEYTDYLLDLGLPLAPHPQSTVAALNALDDATKEELFRIGLVIPLEYSDTADGPMKREYFPAWTLKSTYSWETVFPAGQTVVVEHHYTPSVGGTVVAMMMQQDSEGYTPAADTRKKYCVDDDLMAAVEKTGVKQEGDWIDYPYFDQWIQYVWSTGLNWGGPIGEFTLTVDKGDPKNFVSFCWDGKVTKTGPTTFEAKASDFYPPWDRELEILILDYREPY